MPDSRDRLSAAVAAVAHAGAICRRLQRHLGSLGTQAKADDSPVTIADFAAQAVVARTLAERLGRVTLVAEEDASALRRELDEGHPERLAAVVDAVQPEWPGAEPQQVLDAIDLGNADPPRDALHGFWTLDPIDGTKGFIRGGQYAVCLAWIEVGSPQIAVLGCPNLSGDFSRPFDQPDPHGTMYFASAGEGAYEIPCDRPDARPARLHRLAPAEGEPLRLCDSIETWSARGEDVERVAAQVGELAEPFRLDGQAKYAVVARGQADVFMRLPRRSGYVERIWDHAPGARIALEAGCSVSDIFGHPLDFGRGRGMSANRGIVVATPAVHGRLLHAIRSIAPSP